MAPSKTVLLPKINRAAEFVDESFIMMLSFCISIALIATAIIPDISFEVIPFFTNPVSSIPHIEILMKLVRSRLFPVPAVQDYLFFYDKQKIGKKPWFISFKGIHQLKMDIDNKKLPNTITNYLHQQIALPVTK